MAAQRGSSISRCAPEQEKKLCFRLSEGAFPCIRLHGGKSRFASLCRRHGILVRKQCNGRRLETDIVVVRDSTVTSLRQHLHRAGAAAFDRVKSHDRCHIVIAIDGVRAQWLSSRS